MINRRLTGLVSESKKYIAGSVVFQWLSLAANIVLIIAIGLTVERLFAGTVDDAWIALSLPVCAGALSVRFFCTLLISRISFLSSKSVKKMLQHKIYEKLLRLGPSFHESVSVSEIVQTSTEGVEQLEVYFGFYLPQFFYAMLAPITLFAVFA